MPARVNPDVPGEPRLLKKVGKRIRELRERKGLTMAELGSLSKNASCCEALLMDTRPSVHARKCWFPTGLP